MDQQLEKSGQLIGIPIITSIENQSLMYHEDCHCYVEHLLLRKDFKCLVNLLHATIWQRFHLLIDDQKADISSENSVAAINNSEQADSLTKNVFRPCIDLLLDKENIAGMFGSHLSSTLCETDSGVDVPHSECLTHQLYSQWFVLSAVFTGCPKLLHYLLSSYAEHSLDCSERKQMSDDPGSTQFHEVTNVEKDVEGTRITNPSVGFTRSKSSRYLQPLHTDPAAMNYKEKSTHSIETVYQLVNRKMACEFPITDTWIHQSVNLLVSALHLACWRHDFYSISLLLQHGANPNELAVEQVPDELIGTNYVSSGHESFLRVSDNLFFYFDKGISPLHFIALGLRSPPHHSVLEGCQANIIHDNSAFFQRLKSSGINNESWPEINHLKDYNNIECVLLKTGQFSFGEKYEFATKKELVTNCLEVLLRAGANPNIGQSVILKEAYPLDIILQPPTKVYYAPSAARGNQSSISLRLQNLEYCAEQVVAACDTLLCHDAKLSFKFLSNYMWRPELLDCFHLNDVYNSQQLVALLIRLGLFSDTFSASRRPEEFCSVSVFTSVIIHRFVADVMNTSVPASLIFLILNWCSVTFLHDIVETVAKIAQISGWSDNLKQLSDIACSLQLRSLKHSCFCTILSRVGYSVSSIWSLPLPTRLKMELTHLHV